MAIHQSIDSPIGVTVFGSAIVRVTPDLAVVRFSVSRESLHPRDAFASVRQATLAVRTYLKQHHFDDVGSSQIDLIEERRPIKGEMQFVGYSATVEFRVVISEMGRLEDFLAGVIDAGVNRIRSVDFQSSKLKDLRITVRRRAMSAAHEKAAIYCEAAGVRLGKVVHIEDIDPEKVQPERFHRTEEVEPQADDEGDSSSFDPSSITISAAVMVSFTISSD